MIRPECIGDVHNVKAPNGMQLNITIKDDSSEFALYKKLGLDVFYKPAANVVEKSVQAVIEKVGVPKKPKGATDKK